MEKLKGSNYQAQYNDWLLGALLTHVPEARADDVSGNSYRDSRATFEHLKEIADPGANRMLITRKNIDNKKEYVFTALFVATNNPHPLTIPENDRRFLCVDNVGPQPPTRKSRRYSRGVHHPKISVLDALGT